jgi:hypothetical protein
MVALNEEERFVSGKPVALILATVLIGAALFKWWPSDERDVRRQLDALADALTVPSTDTDAAKVARIVEFRSYFAPEAHVRVGTADLPDRDALVAAVEHWTTPPGGVFVEFVSEKLTFPGDNTAQVSLIAKVTARSAAADEPTVDERNATIALAKRDGDWVITKVESPEELPPVQRNR